LSSDALRNPGKDDINEVIMSANMKSVTNKLHDYASSQIDEFERGLKKIIHDAALDFSDVQVREVMNVAFQLLRERGEFSQKHIDALETCRKAPELNPSAETLEAWVEQFYTKARDCLHGLYYDGIEFEDERVKEAFDVGFRLLKLYDEYENRALDHIIEKVKTR
jgi:hypothetical protein